MKFIATLLLGLAMVSTDLASAQTSADTTKTQDLSSLKWRKDKKKAKKLLKKNDYQAAIPYLEDGAKKKAKKVYFAQNLAPAYLTLRDYKSANQWYGVLVQKDSVKHKKPQYIFDYAMTQKYMGQYEQAMVTFAKYRKMAGDNDEMSDMKKRSTREIEGCQKGIFFRDSVPNKAFKVNHLSINQPSADYSPMMRNGSLYYSSDIGSKYSRLFKAAKSGKEWNSGETISNNVNVPGQNVGNPTFTPDGNTMYYTQCLENDLHKQKCMIYRSNFNNGEWEAGKSVGLGVNDPLYSNTQPAVGKNKDNEDVLYFVSDRNPGKGLDIFYAKINADGSIGKARSAGPQINTKGDEVSPYFDFKSKTLYFSSNGWINIGGLDVFKTTFDQNGEWTEPENLGMPINSSTDDVNFSINEQGTRGFVVSNRPAGFGNKNETCCDDIYEVETTKIFLAVRGDVYEEKEGQRVIADHGMVSLYDERNGTELSSYNLINGGYFFDLEPKRGYKLVTRKDGFYDGVLPFNTDNSTESDTMKYDLFLKKKIEQTNPLIGRVIGKVYYDYDVAKLRPDARDTLRKVMDILTQYPNIVIEVGAHTDGKGTEAYNLALSQKRAEAVMNYYIYEKKLDPERFVVHPFGTSQPAASNTNADGTDNPEGRALNRRTEFKIIDELKPDWKEAKKAKMAEQRKNQKEEEVKPAPRIPGAAAPKSPVKETPPAKVIKRDMAPPKRPTSENKAPMAPAANPAIASATTKMPKEDMAPAPKVDVRKANPATTPPAPAATPENPGYKTAPNGKVEVKGMVYEEKAGQRRLVSQAAVFLTTNEGGFQQQVQYVKGDGAYSFDITRANADTFKLIARKFKYESNEVIFTIDDIKASNKPIDLIIKMP